MAQGRSRTAVQRGIKKVKKVRLVIFLLLLCVAVAIFMVDKQSQKQLAIQASINPSQAIGGNTITTNISNDRYEEKTIADTPLSNQSNKPNISAPPDNILADSSAKISNTIVSSDVVPFHVITAKDTRAIEKAKKQKIQNRRAKLRTKRRIPKRRDIRKRKTPRRRRVWHTKYYVIAAGDTFSGMAKRYYGKSSLWRALFHANRKRVSKPGKLRVGQKIYLPPKKKLMAFYKTPRRVIPKASRGGHFRSTPDRRRRRSSPRTYYVRRGDNLRKIARKLNISFLSLLDANPNLEDPNKLLLDAKIVIPRSINALASHR